VEETTWNKLHIQSWGKYLYKSPLAGGGGTCAIQATQVVDG